METESAKEGRQLRDMTLAEMDEYWDKSKEISK